MMKQPPSPAVFHLPGALAPSANARDFLPEVEQEALPNVLRQPRALQTCVCLIGWLMLCAVCMIAYSLVPALQNIIFVSASLFVLTVWIVATFPRIAHFGLNSILTYQHISDNVSSKAAFFRMSLISIPVIVVGLYISTYTRYDDIMHLPTVVQLSIMRGILQNFVDINKVIGRIVIYFASRNR